MNDARTALAAFRESASWPWGSATLHAGYRQGSGGNTEAWVVAVEGDRLLFAAHLGTSFGMWSFRVGLQRSDVIIVDATVALLATWTLHPHESGGDDDVVVVTREGGLRARLPGLLDPTEPPRREGTRLRLRFRDAGPGGGLIRQVDLGPLDAAASAHGYIGGALMSLHGRCQAMHAVEARRARRVLLVALPPMAEAVRDEVFRAWAEQTAAPLPGVLAAEGWLPPVEPSGPSLLVLDSPRGVPLIARVTPATPLPAREARVVVNAVSNALGQAHRRGRIHGLLARDRVWLAEGSAQLMDVGLERALAAHGPPEDPERAPSLGTLLSWAAPEVLEGRGDARSDVWSLAMMAFWLCTGADYWSFDGGVGALWVEMSRGPRWFASERARALGTPQRAPLGPAFDAWFLRCVARDPGARFADIDSAAAALPWEASSAATGG